VPGIVQRARQSQASFPLTLALSPREREIVIQSGRVPQRLRTISTPEPRLPLPQGEGRGEGEGGLGVFLSQESLKAGRQTGVLKHDLRGFMTG
jgi:hypothetical protein